MRLELPESPAEPPPGAQGAALGSFSLRVRGPDPAGREEPEGPRGLKWERCLPSWHWRSWQQGLPLACPRPTRPPAHALTHVSPEQRSSAGDTVKVGWTLGVPRNQGRCPLPEPTYLLRWHKPLLGRGKAAAEQSF